MVLFLFPCWSVAPESDHELSALSWSLFRHIFHPTVNTVSSHRVHLGHQTAVGSWHTPGDPVTENIMFHGEQQGNTTINHWKTYVISTYHAQEWKDCGSDPRKGSAISNRIAALLCLMLLFVLLCRVCYPLGSQPKSKLHHFTQATDLLCHLKCDRQASPSWAGVKCCTAPLLQTQAGCSLQLKEKDTPKSDHNRFGERF